MNTHPDYSRYNWENMQRARVKAWETMSYPDALAFRDGLESARRECGARLEAIPGCGSGPMGLTPDHVKKSYQWRSARQDHADAMAKLQDFNRWFVKRFKAEERQRRAARIPA
jgi:hypothetical protein